MKKIILLLSVCGVASAQTSAPATNAPVPPVTMDITSKSFDLDQGLRQVVYHNHVVFTNPQVRLTCERLTVIFPTNKSRHLDQVQAETNVVIDYTDGGDKYHVTAAKGVYVCTVANSVTNETVTFTGEPKVETADGWLTGEPIYYTRVNGQKGGFHADNPHMNYKQPSTGTNTDAAPLKLF